jgi:hypothetical protein
MNMRKLIGLALLLLSNSNIAPAAPHDGQHDFDWEIGTWDTQLKRLREPLSGKTDWVEYAGTSSVKPVMGARANLVELDVRGSAGRIAACRCACTSRRAASGPCISPTWPTA